MDNENKNIDSNEREDMQARRKHLRKKVLGKLAPFLAILLALILMTGVTYSWFTYSVGVQAGSLSMDYVQVTGEFGAFIRPSDLFALAFYFHDDCAVERIPVRRVAPLGRQPGPLVTAAGWDPDNGLFGLDGLGYIFVPTRYFQNPDYFGGLRQFLETTVYRSENADDQAFDGLSLWHILTNARAYYGDEEFVPFFHTSLQGSNAAGAATLTYEFMTLEEIFGLNPATYANADEIAANVMNTVFNRLFPGQHLVCLTQSNRYPGAECENGDCDYFHARPRSMRVGWRIQNLGGAAYISLGNPIDQIFVGQRLLVEHDERREYVNPFTWEMPAWGVGKWGNLIPGHDVVVDDVNPIQRGWAVGVRAGTFTVDSMVNPNVLYPLDIPGGGNITRQEVRDKIDDLLGIQDNINPRLIDRLEALYDQLQRREDSILPANPDDLPWPSWRYNRLVATHHADQQFGWISSATDWDPVFGIWFQSHPSHWPNVPEQHLDAGLFEVPIGIVSPTGFVQNQPRANMPNEIRVPLVQINAAYAVSAAEIYGPLNSHWNSAQGQGGSHRYWADVYPPHVNLPQRWIFDDSDDWRITAAYVNEMSVALGSDDAVDGIELITVTDGEDNVLTTILHVTGSEFTHQTLETAPYIDIMMDITFGRYLDNRFQGAVISIGDLPIVAVQDTVDAANELLLQRAGINEDISTFVPSGFNSELLRDPSVLNRTW